MVKVIGLSEREKAEKKGLEEMAGIASELFPGARIANVGALAMGIFLENKGMINVNPGQTQVRIEKPECFDEAIKLARAYEEKYGKEFTVKKEYE